MKIAAWFGKCAARAVVAIAHSAENTVWGTMDAAVEFKKAYTAEYKARRNANARPLPKTDSSAAA